MDGMYNAVVQHFSKTLMNENIRSIYAVWRKLTRKDLVSISGKKLNLIYIKNDDGKMHTYQTIISPVLLTVQ